MDGRGCAVDLRDDGAPAPALALGDPNGPLGGPDGMMPAVLPPLPLLNRPLTKAPAACRRWRLRMSAFCCMTIVVGTRAADDEE